MLLIQLCAHKSSCKLLHQHCRMQRSLRQDSIAKLLQLFCQRLFSSDVLIVIDVIIATISYFCIVVDNTSTNAWEVESKILNCKLILTCNLNVTFLSHQLSSESACCDV